MTTPQPLPYARSESELLTARRRRLVTSAAIVACSIIVTPIILWMLYTLNQKQGTEYATVYLITAIDPYLALLMFTRVPDFVMGMALFFQIPFYGVLLGFGYYMRRLTIVAVILLLVHLVAASIAFFIVLTSGMTPGFYS